MTTNQITASIIETSPRAAGWIEIFGRTSDIPLKDAWARPARHRDTGIISVYELDLSAITADERERLIDFLAKHFNLPREEVAGDLDREGVPIRVEDVLISIPLGLALSMSEWDYPEEDDPPPCDCPCIDCIEGHHCGSGEQPDPDGPILYCGWPAPDEDEDEEWLNLHARDGSRDDYGFGEDDDDDF